MTKILVDKIVLEQALDAMLNFPDDISDEMFESITSLKAALAEPVQEPVGYLPAYELNRLQSGHDGRLRSAKFGPSELDGDVAVYTAPPKAEPVQEIEDLRSSLNFYQRRCEALQSWQSKMRDPERVIVCDILANGKTLDPAVAGDRYTAPPQRGALTDEEIRSMCKQPWVFEAVMQWVRVIEKAHGIGE